MKILILTPWFPDHKQDQQGNFILDSVESLVHDGHDVVVLVTRPWRPRGIGLILKEWSQKNIEIKHFSSQMKLHVCHYLSIPRYLLCSLTIWSYRNRVNPILENLVTQYQPHVIHAHTELSGVSAVDIGRKFDIPSVISLHGISTEPKLYYGATKKLFYDYAIQKTNRVVLVGKPLFNFFQNMVKKHDHFRIVNNGFRPCSYHERYVQKSFKNLSIRFISVSNLVEGKGIDINLHALEKLKNKGILDWTYKIIGDGNEKKSLEKLVHQLNLTQKVFFLGACNHDEVYHQLSQSDVFILPSYREAFGVAYVEAMSCGLLAIGIQGQGAEAFIEHEKTGFLAQPNNIDSLTEILTNIYESRDTIKTIAKAGRNHVHHHFTWKNHAKHLTKIYQELINVS